MNNKVKRTVIGLVFPTLVIILVCAVFYYKNAHQSLIEGMKASDGTSYSKVKITEKNWEEYFTVETKMELFNNDAGELEKVQYIDYISLKEEYREKIALEEKNYVSISGTQKTERMTYRITDAKAGEWEITGKLIYDKPKGENDNANRSWGQADEGEFMTVYEHDSGEYVGQVYLEVPEEFEAEAVVGELHFK